MKPRSRKEAIRLGLTRYFTGKPCKHGHICDRSAPDGRCRECVRLFQSELRKREEFRTRSIKQAAVWRQQNPERARRLDRLSYERNKEKRIAQAKRWQKLHPEIQAIKNGNRRARLANAPGKYTKDDIFRIRKLQGDKCAMPNCRKLLKGKGTIDHIVPLMLGGSNHPRNLQLLCGNCNSQKHTKDPIDYSRSMGLLL